MVSDGFRGSVVPEEIRFCQRCGAGLATKTFEGVTRPYCPRCGHIVFLDPKLAAVVLASSQDRLVLVRRAIEPAMGRWSFPSGYVDRGEVVEHAARREVKEETDLEVALDGLVGLYSGGDSPVVLAVYAARVVGGKPRPGPEVHEVGLFSPDELPDLPFPHDYQILADWRSFDATRGQA